VAIVKLRLLNNLTYLRRRRGHVLDNAWLASSTFISQSTHS